MSNTVQDKLIIPKKVKVGFQNRDGTYTGKLAFVVYVDHKGKLRMERSWEGWRDKKIEPMEFDNEPTTGFVLNKKVGDYSSRWGGRRAWIRIYDPRGFEFEISVENLLFVLEHTSAIQGKGLEGEFVLAWGGSGSNCKVMLLPTNSEDYKESVSYNALQTKKVGKKDMQDGCVYRTKDNDDYMYLGRHDFYEMVGYYDKRMTRSKLHIFVSVDGKSTYWTQKGFTKLATRLSDDPSPLYADEFEKFMKSEHGSKVVEITGTPAKPDLADRYSIRGSYYLKRDDGYHRIEFNYNYSNYGYGWRSSPREPTWQIREAKQPVKLTTDGNFVWPREGAFGDYKDLTKEQAAGMHFYTISAKNEQGAVRAI